VQFLASPTHQPDLEDTEEAELALLEDNVSNRSSACDCPAHIHDRETPLIIDKGMSQAFNMSPQLEQVQQRHLSPEVVTPSPHHLQSQVATPSSHQDLPSEVETPSPSQVQHFSPQFKQPLSPLVVTTPQPSQQPTPPRASPPAPPPPPTAPPPAPPLPAETGDIAALCTLPRHHYSYGVLEKKWSL